MITYHTIDVPMPAFRHRDITAWVHGGSGL